MRILYLTEQIYLHGGAEKILIQKLNYWVQWFGYDVLLVTWQQNGKKPFLPLHENVKWLDLGINYHEGVSYFNPKNFSKFPKHLSRLRNAITEFAPDTIFLLSLGFVRFILPLISGKSKIYNEYHTSYYGLHLRYRQSTFAGKIKMRLMSAVIASAESFYTKIVFLNDAEYNHYNRKNGIVIPNFFDEATHSENVPRKKKAITLGRLSREKGYDKLVDAWKIVDKKNPGWILEIYGNGDCHSDLSSYIESNHLTHTIHLKAATSEVAAKLSESALYVLTSRFETFPMAVLEAMSHKLPVVAFNCPTGIATIVTDNEDGFLVGQNDTEALAQKMLLLIQDGNLCQQMGEKAFLNVQRFHPKSVMAQWNLLINNNCG